MNPHTTPFCVIGAGTMGSGIAQVAAQSGYPTLLFDVSAAMLEKAGTAIRKNLQWLVDKEKISPNDRDAALGRLRFAGSLSDCRARIIVEAIVEKPEPKVALFRELDQYNDPDTIFASNTSSLSINLLQQQIPHPQRVAGMHFFNPAPAMKLVELVKGSQTDDAVIGQLAACCREMRKVPVVCNDAPGFIVNRVARHYYLEAMKLVETGVAGMEAADSILEATGFKMGPFRLMDLIGNDVNLAVSQSLYNAFHQEPRFRPSALQEEKVKLGMLGKKTGKGFYEY